MKKKWLLVAIGLMSFSIFTSSQVYANESEKLSTEEEQAVDLYENEEIDGIIEDPEMESAAPVKARSLSGSRTVTLQKLYFAITDEKMSGPSAPMPNTNFSVSYTYNNKETLLHEGRTNASGEILNLTFPNIPNEVTSLIVRFYLGNDERGFIERYNNRPYTFHHARTIPANSIINASSNTARFGVAGDSDTFFYNYQATRLNYFYDQAVQEFTNLIKNTNDLLPETAKFKVEPISMNFKKGEYLDQNNAFFRNGYDNKGVANIVIGDRSDRVYTEQAIKSKVMHEWTHWNSYRETQAGIPGTLVNSFGYREGWAYFVGHMFANNYDLSSKDLLVQNDNYNGVNRYFGKASSVTAEHVLYDLLDVVSKDEDFSISRRFLDTPLPELEKRKINLGLMHTIMVESKATNLQEYLSYMEKKYVLTSSDKKEYRKALEINGLSKDGYYTLNEDGTPVQK